MLQRAIRALTDQPVLPCHRHGRAGSPLARNGYWQAQGATVIASSGGDADHRAVGDQMIALGCSFLGEGWRPT